jgi:hypothetical protein
MNTVIPGIVTHVSTVTSISKDDSRLLAYVGGTVQDLDTTVYIYDQVLGGRWLNTSTGQVGGVWGTTGAYTGDSGFLIHNAHISKNGRWARITKAGGGIYFWDITTLLLTTCSPGCGGHIVQGFDSAVNNRGTGDGMEFARRSMADVAVTTSWPSPLLTPAEFTNGTHLSWNNVTSSETEPIVLEAYKAGSTVDRAWDEEILAMSTSGTSYVWRFCHHRTAYSTFETTPRPSVSQDGRMALFTSNWGDSVGTGRVDVFAVELL